MTEIVRLSNLPPPAKETECQIRAFRELKDFFRACLVQRQIGVAVGRTGTGKTTAAKAFVRDEHYAFYLRVQKTMQRPRQFLAKLLTAVGGYPEQCWGEVELLDQIISRLESSWTAHLLILDEMNYATEDMVHISRDLYDAVRCGIVLLGTPEMESIWAPTAKGKGDPFAAFRARKPQTHDVKPPCTDDIIPLCRFYGLTGKSESDLIKRYLTARDGLHNLEHLMNNAQFIAGAGKPITAEHLIKADLLSGGRQ